MPNRLLHGIQHDLNDRVNKILVVAKYCGVDVEYDANFKYTDMDLEPFLRNAHPLGKGPVLETENGYLFESNAIVRYVLRLDKNNTGLYGRTPFEQAQVDQWLDFDTSEIADSRTVLVRNSFLGAQPAEALAEAKSRLRTVFEGLNCWLEIRTFLVGERLTAADLVLASTINSAVKLLTGKDAEVYNDLYDFQRWFYTVAAQKPFVEVLKWAKPKEEKKAVEAPKKEEKPKEKPKAKEAEDDEGEENFDEPKKKNPLDLLPPSSFVLDSFKREYSNKDIRKEAAPYFFDNFDPAGYSAFYCTYKYNEENKMQFMTGNLVRGWFQRMDRLHKYAFGVVLLVGEETKHDIIGFFVFRGQGLPEIMLEVDDTEHYNWTPIADVNAERNRITDFFAWDGDSFKTTPVLEGRVFK